MIFTKRLRDGVREGLITRSIRIWQRPHVRVGGRYGMEEGEIEVDSILPISLSDVTPELARASGFKGVIDLLKVAKHGRGENVYLVRFHFVPARRRGPGRADAPSLRVRRAANRSPRLSENGSMVKTNVSPVDAYIQKRPAEVQEVLRRVRGIIRKALPGADEVISYQIPAYKLEGQYVVYFAGWKQHWSLYPVTEPVRASLGPELASYEVSKGTVRFPLAEKVPAKLVERIVRELARGASERASAKSSPKRGDDRRRPAGGTRKRKGP